jgi:murein DD-endopeptidase MepM/ murein hydrolase activator NlpD
VGAGVLALAAAGITGAVIAAGTATDDSASAVGAGSTVSSSTVSSSTVSSGLPRLVTPARTAPDVSSAEAVVTGTRDRRERAVSRDAHREAQLSASTRKLQAVTEKAARKRAAALAGLAAGARRQARVIAENTWQLPVTPGAYHLTSRFGDCSSLWSRCHTGLDFAAPDGTPIHAVAAGTVKEVGYAGAYGNRTVMTTRDGTDLWYCHQAATSVEQGERVVAGQVIGAVGSTGNTTGPHVHLEVRPRPDDPVDPFAALVAHGLHP